MIIIDEKPLILNQWSTPAPGSTPLTRGGGRRRACWHHLQM